MSLKRNVTNAEPKDVLTFFTRYFGNNLKPVISAHIVTVVSVSIRFPIVGMLIRSPIVYVMMPALGSLLWIW